jgi:hypothetical protein
MRLGPLNAELNTHALIESQSHFARTEVVPENIKIVFDAVGIPDVPGTSGIDVKPPNVLLASAESGNMVATASENLVATAFNDDLVRHMDDENTTVVRGDSTGNAVGLAC